MAITRRSLAETYEAQDLIIQAAQDAKREATKAYREQLDRVGMDKDAIKSEVEGFKLAYRRKVAVEKKGSDEVEHRDAIADEIFLEITSPAPRATRVATTVPDGFDPETGEEITEPQEAQAPAQAGHASPVPDAQSGAGNVGNSLPGTESAEDREPIIEPQPAPQAERDLTDPEPSGQVATNPEAKASEDGGATVQHIGLADDSVTGDASRASDGAAIIHLETASEGTSRIPNVSGHDSAKSEVLSATSDPSEFAGSSNGRTAEFDSADAGSTPAPASTVTAFTPKPLRPYCQSPGNTCGGMGRKHCFKCQKAHDEQQGAA